MIIASLIIGSLLLGAAIAVFWKEIITWLKSAYDKLKQMLGIIVQGSEVFLKKIQGGFQEISYNYSRTPGEKKWRRDTVIKKEVVSVEEIPDDIKLLAEQAEIDMQFDITEHLGEKLQLAMKG